MSVSNIESELVVISQKLRSSTVEIIARYTGGSGVIWSSKGLVVTNSHVVERSQSPVNTSMGQSWKTRSPLSVKLENGRVIQGAVIASDPHADLAAIQLKIEKSEVLPTPIIGNSQLLRPGEIVLAMGSPYGFSGTLTMGVIHASLRQEVAETKFNGTEKTSDDLGYPNGSIVADIRLAPGNSGGILANARGEVIGINVAIFGGLALAIPSQRVEHFIKTISQ